MGRPDTLIHRPSLSGDFFGDLLSIMEHAIDDLATGIDHAAPAIHFVVDPSTLVEGAIGERKNAIALPQIFAELTLVACTIVVFVGTLSMHQPIRVQAFV